MIYYGFLVLTNFDFQQLLYLFSKHVNKQFLRRNWRIERLRLVRTWAVRIFAHPKNGKDDESHPKLIPLATS